MSTVNPKTMTLAFISFTRMKILNSDSDDSFLVRAYSSVGSSGEVLVIGLIYTHTRCYERCWWLVKETGPCLLNRDTCEYHGLLGLDPLLNRPGAHAGPLPGPPHEAALGGPLY